MDWRARAPARGDLHASFQVSANFNALPTAVAPHFEYSTSQQIAALPRVAASRRRLTGETLVAMCRPCPAWRGGRVVKGSRL